MNSDVADRLESPIFICGCHRSGTTLMQTILARHPEVEILPETKLFAWLWSPWKSLRRRRGREVLREITQSIGEINRAWGLAENQEFLERLKASELAVPERFSSVSEVMEHLLRVCPGEASVRVGEKTPLHIYHLGDLLQFFPQAKVVIMSRDLRGAYHSQASRAEKAQWSYRSFRSLLFVTAWRQAEALARHFLRLHGNSRIHRLSYEELVSKPERELRELCRFLDLSFDPVMLEVSGGNSSFEDESAGISSQSAKRWQHEMSLEMQEELSYLGQPYLGEIELKKGASIQLRFSLLLLRASDAFAVRFPQLMCYLGRDSRYRKVLND